MYRRDPLTGTDRLVAPGRAERLGPRAHGCPFCAGNETVTPPETGSRPRRETTPTAAAWAARSFPNLFPLTAPHEVVVPTPRHATSWRELTLPELQDGLALVLERRTAVRADGRYVHTFINDGAGAGASISHVHAQLVVLDRGAHTETLVHAVTDPDECGVCTLLAARPELVVQRGLHHTLLAHPVPRMAGGLLLVPNVHDCDPSDEHIAELAELVHRAWAAIGPDLDSNLWLVADEERGAHWYMELQPRTANFAGVELALGLLVSAADAEATAQRARERLAMPVGH